MSKRLTIEEFIKTLSKGGSSGNGFYTFQVDVYAMPLVTLGEIRTAFASGNIMLGVYASGDQTEWHLVEKFTDGGQGASHSFIQLHGTQYQSTSGADDATWENYD